MRKKILTITDVWQIKKGNIAIAGKRQEEHIYGIGTSLIIIRPDGTKIETKVSGIEKMITVSGTKMEAILILNLTKEDLPSGSNVFLGSEN